MSVAPRGVSLVLIHHTAYEPAGGYTRVDLHAIPVAIPERVEQEQLVVELRDWLARLDDLRSTIDTQVNKLREYRQSLITAAVTGQLPIEEATP